jgi:AraC family transcriptional regulator
MSLIQFTGPDSIRSLRANGSELRRGYSSELRSFGGARAVRVIDRPSYTVEEHAHDWPVLSLHVLGSCTRRFGGEELNLAGPSAVLHPRGQFHSSIVGNTGLEQIDVEFDPAWLGAFHLRQLTRPIQLRGGGLGAATRRLANMWSSERNSEGDLRLATLQLFEAARRMEPVKEPHWLARVQDHIATDPGLTAKRLALALNMSPTWLTQAYRVSTGEGLQQAITRHRVERATAMLRETGEPAAEIAVACGFFDQSHMIRCFGRILGRTPTRVRAERCSL